MSLRQLMIAAFLLLPIAAGCAHTGSSHTQPEAAVVATVTDATHTPAFQEKVPEHDPVHDIGSLVEETPDAEALPTGEVVVDPQIGGIPLVYNPHVQVFIDYFKGRGSERFELWLQRSGTYIPVMEKILLEEGLPKELVYLALIESGFSSHAYSHAAAVGYWQFIGSTGKAYGLRIDDWVDERRDPIKATRAAAAYLKDLYGMFGDWHLAAAGYNAGENKVKRAIKRYGTKDYWRIIEQRYLARETKQYVPKLIAAITIAENPEKYGFYPAYFSPLNTRQVEAPGGTDVAKLAYAAGITLGEFRRLNPELRRWMTPPDVKTYTLHVPPEAADDFAQRLAGVPADVVLPLQAVTLGSGERLEDLAARYKVSLEDLALLNPDAQGWDGEDIILPIALDGTRLADRPTGPRWGYYTVRRGDTLSQIANRYRTNVYRIKSTNGLRSNSIQVGQRLKVPIRGYAYNSRSGKATTKQATYKVRPGDSLSAIASRHGTTVANLRKLNNLQGSVIHAGQTLNLTSAKPTTYRVRRGDTLIGIAKRYSVNPSQLAKANGITGDVLYAGQSIQIPQ